MKRRYRPTGPSTDVVEALYERAGWSCEVCTAAVGPRRGVDHHVHHRRPRGAGGTRRTDTNDISNLLLLDPSCHAMVESERDGAYGGGWLVRQSADPATERVLIAGKWWVLLTPEGGYKTLEPAR